MANFARAELTPKVLGILRKSKNTSDLHYRVAQLAAVSQGWMKSAIAKEAGITREGLRFRFQKIEQELKNDPELESLFNSLKSEIPKAQNHTAACNSSKKLSSFDLTLSLLESDLRKLCRKANNAKYGPSIEEKEKIANLREIISKLRSGEMELRNLFVTSFLVGKPPPN